MDNKELKVLNFNYNWNTKLRCRSFTTIRLRNDAKYFKGARFSITLQNYQKGIAKVIDVKFMTLDKVSEWIARLDTGYSAKECKEIIKTMYKNKPLIDWKTQELAYVLLKWENQEGMNHLFEELGKE